MSYTLFVYKWLNDSTGSDYCMLVLSCPILCVTVKLLKFLLPVHFLQVLWQKDEKVKLALQMVSILLRITCMASVVQTDKKKKKGAISKTLNNF